MNAQLGLLFVRVVCQLCFFENCAFLVKFRVQHGTDTTPRTWCALFRIVFLHMPGPFSMSAPAVVSFLAAIYNSWTNKSGWGLKAKNSTASQLEIPFKYLIRTLAITRY